MSEELFYSFYVQKQNAFIYEKGRNKFDTLYQKVKNSSILAKLEGMSIHGRQAPSAKDFCVLATNIWYISIKFDQKTNEMGALIALKIWKEQINDVYQLASDYELYTKAVSISNQLNR